MAFITYPMIDVDEDPRRRKKQNRRFQTLVGTGTSGLHRLYQVICLSPSPNNLCIVQTRLLGSRELKFINIYSRAIVFS